MKDSMIAFTEVSGNTSSLKLKEKIEEIIIDFNIANKIFSITSDNAANCIKAIEMLDKISYLGHPSLDIRCAPHSLNLVGKSALTNVEEELKLVRSFTNSIRSSSKISAELKDLSKIKNIEFKKVKSDCPTRWNSTLISIDR